MKIIFKVFLFLATTIPINAQITKVAGTVYNESRAGMVGIKVVLKEIGLDATVT